MVGRWCAGGWDGWGRVGVEWVGGGGSVVGWWGVERVVCGGGGGGGGWGGGGWVGNSPGSAFGWLGAYGAPILEPPNYSTYSNHHLPPQPSLPGPPKLFKLFKPPKVLIV